MTYTGHKFECQCADECASALHLRAPLTAPGTGLRSAGAGTATPLVRRSHAKVIAYSLVSPLCASLQATVAPELTENVSSGSQRQQLDIVSLLLPVGRPTCVMVKGPEAVDMAVGGRGLFCGRVLAGLTGRRAELSGEAQHTLRSPPLPSPLCTLAV